MSNKTNILGVDDKQENLLALEEIVTTPDINFIKASSGREALECLLREEVALILMDVMMPEMDGYETAEIIRARKRSQHIPIIFITAIDAHPDHLFKGYNSGAVDFLFKPIIPGVLKSKIAVFIELFRQGRSLRVKAGELELANERISLQQQSLRESEVRFRTAFEQSFQFMAILDSQGRVIELNRLAKKLCGDINGVLKGQYLWNICWVGQDQENQSLKESLAKAMSGECVSDEACFTDISGRQRYLVRAISPVKDDRGKVKYITVQGHDITKRIDAERENQNLEKLLQQAQKMEALGTLAGGIAHDFNNVLSVIIGNADLARNSLGIDIKQRQYLNRIFSAANKAKELVKQILSFSRQAEVERVVLQPAAIVLESIKLLRASIPATIAVEYKVDEECGAIWADPTQYHQILMNLCTNSFHAMEENGGSLYIELVQEFVDEKDFPYDVIGGSGFFAHLIVKDTGQGINETLIKKIFEPYFTTKEKGRGTGMGLAIVHGIVKSQGGFLKVDSQVGRGTCFHVYLPLASSEGKAVEETFDSLSYGTENILLIDDEIQLLEMVRNMLELVGYRVSTESSSIEALEHFCDNPSKYDLIITDQTMPGMTGTELARRMLRIRPDVPIILWTGYSPKLSRESVLSLGIKELAFKPLALDEMSKIVRQTIDSTV